MAAQSDIFFTYVEMGNDKCTGMQLKFQGSQNPSMFETTPTVAGTGPYHTVASHAVMAQKFWGLNIQYKAFAWVVWLG